jgi:hypothetical protein
MENGSFVIGKQRKEEGFDFFFGKVSGVSNGVVSGRIEKDFHVKQKFFEVSTKDILVDLGANPHAGSVYGQDVTCRLTAKREHDFFGRIFWLYKPRKEAVTAIDDALDQAASILKKHKLPRLPDDVVLEMRSNEVKSKWAGYYKHSKAPDKNPHRISVKPESVSLRESDIVYCILHEYAHWFHHNCATGPKLNARWVRLFNTSIKLQTVTKADSASLMESLLGGQERPSDFKSTLDEDQRNQFNWICRTIKSDHALSVAELDLLFESDFKEDIRAVWPTRTLHKKDLKPVISEYACVNYKETFAEAMSMHLLKKKLPESVISMVEKSIEFGRANSEKT